MNGVEMDDLVDTNICIKCDDEKLLSDWIRLVLFGKEVKSLKGRSGIIGKGVTENAMNVWTKTMHR